MLSANASLWSSNGAGPTPRSVSATAPVENENARDFPPLLVATPVIMPAPLSARTAAKLPPGSTLRLVTASSCPFSHATVWPPFLAAPARLLPLSRANARNGEDNGAGPIWLSRPPFARPLNRKPTGLLSSDSSSAM